MKRLMSVIASVACLGLTTMSANAAPVSGTLSATYYQVAYGSPDFPVGGTVPQVANGSTLINGLPHVTSGAAASNIGPNGELLWWSPSNPIVTVTGTGTITLPYGSNMYAPNSTGGNNASFFETARFSGTFNLSSAGTVNFQVGSDDDTFVYLNGILIGQNPGIHATSVVNFAGSGVFGSNTLEIFYADRQQTGAYLAVSADVELTATPGVPEPSTWAMMFLGFAGVAGMSYRRTRRGATSIAA